MTLINKPEKILILSQRLSDRMHQQCIVHGNSINKNTIIMQLSNVTLFPGRRWKMHLFVMVVNWNKHLLEKGRSDATLKIFYSGKPHLVKDGLRMKSNKIEAKSMERAITEPNEIQFNSLPKLINKCWSCLSPFKELSAKTNTSNPPIFL